MPYLDPFLLEINLQTFNVVYRRIRFQCMYLKSMACQRFIRILQHSGIVSRSLNIRKDVYVKHL